MKVPQLSPWIGREEYQAIAASFEENWITEGPKSKEFSQKLLELIGSKYGVFAPNGTLAIFLGLKAIGIKPGDEVVVPDFTFIASGTAVEMVGATPVFVDVNRRNFQIDLAKAEKSITRKTKAIMPVHIYGTVCNMDEVMSFAKKHKIKVIEDAAEAIAVSWKGKHAGSFGDVGCFSFFADKTITTGEGGFVVTDDEKIYENLLYLRNQGRIDRGSFIHPKIGYNFRLTDIQSAIGLAQLEKLPEIVKRKKYLLNLYLRLLKNVGGITFFKPPMGADWIPFRMCFLHKDAHALMSFMKSKEIETRTFFYPLHKQPAFSYLARKYQDSEFPNSIHGYKEGICLPIFPTLADEQVKYICDMIKEFQGRKLFYQYYDVVYQNKDYSGETSLVFNLSEKFGLGTPKRILEIGCGTGNHTRELAAKNSTSIVAIDIDHEMIKIAQKKLNSIKNVEVQETTVEELQKNSFDMGLAMFNVINYLPDAQKLESFFQTVNDKLMPGGIFVFDTWNGAAALLDPPKNKKMTAKRNSEQVEFELISKTDFFNQITNLTYRVNVSDGKVKKTGSVSFNQTLWMPREILSAIKKAGLEIILTSPLMYPDTNATEKDWKIMFCVKKPLT